MGQLRGTKTARASDPFKWSPKSGNEQLKRRKKKTAKGVLLSTLVDKGRATHPNGEASAVLHLQEVRRRFLDLPEPGSQNTPLQILWEQMAPAKAVASGSLDMILGTGSVDPK